jgi:hypothetical protein
VQLRGVAVAAKWIDRGAVPLTGIAEAEQFREHIGAGSTVTVPVFEQVMPSMLAVMVQV